MSDILNYVICVSKNASMTMGSEARGLDRSAASRKKTLRGAATMPGVSDTASVFVECFKFLKALARNNLEVQMRWGECQCSGYCTGCMSVLTVLFV